MMASEQLHGTVERGAVMAESHLQKVICKAVCVALLISGDLEAAENAVADAIQSLDALQLAIALDLKQLGQVSLMVTADQRLSRVAPLAGCPAVNPEKPGPVLI